MLTALRPARINFYLRFMGERGFTADQVLSGTGLHQGDLKKSDTLVSIPHFIRIVSNIRRLYVGSDLAFDMGNALEMSDLGILGYAITSAPNSGIGAQIWNRYLPLFFSNIVEAVYHTDSGISLVQYCPFAELKADLLQFLIEEKISYDHALHRLIGMDEYPVESLSLTYPPPPHRHRYHELYGPRIYFDADIILLKIKDYGHDIPLKGADAETHACCLREMAAIDQYVKQGASYSFRIKALITRNLASTPRLEDLALHFNCSTRTLVRKLEAEGSSFSRLFDDARREMAENLLATSDLPVKEIAVRLGFSESSSFRRFFRSASGLTVTDFKRSTQATVSQTAKP